jgi:hypothetical protein
MMRWRNKTYAFASRLQMTADHADYALEAPFGFGHHHLIVADLVILTKNALQVAMVKKYIANAVGAADQGLFAFVIDDGIYVIMMIRFAIAQFIRITVGLAIARTESTIFK